MSELVTIKIDGKELKVPKGMNVIEAAKTAGIEIPHYCYHPNLSIAGNCRMCQCEVKGMAKLEIACNLTAREGLEVSTQETSARVKEAQAATLEFILINHPLDCTVCDQAGHCKLQDYHYDYNANPSRFLEDKVHKVKAEPLGPTVVLDGERCIMCTRCIRFCDEVTGTSELGMLNRGDRSVIAINKDHPLSNPLSGTVVDLCPVGALTHREWRFNTRIWFTKQTDSICTGCSTGCNVKVAVRDHQVVQVKGRMNPAVNKEWLCDEGRYGFNRFLPEKRLTAPRSGQRELSWEDALKSAQKLGAAETLVLLAPDLLLEEYYIIKSFIARSIKNPTVAVAYKERSLTKEEAILVSPDYAPNFQGAVFSGIVSGDLAAGYSAALKKLREGGFQNVLCVGDRAIAQGDLTVETVHGLSKASLSVGLFCDAAAQLSEVVSLAFPARSILETAGLLVNRQGRLQYTDKVIDFPDGTEPCWRIINRITEKSGASLTKAHSDRELTLELLNAESRLKGLKIAAIKAGGVDLRAGSASTPSQQGAHA